MFKVPNPSPRLAPSLVPRRPTRPSLSQSNTQGMQLVALAGIASFFVPSSPMYLPDAFANGTAFLCRSPDSTSRLAGLKRVRWFLEWMPSDRYVAIMADGGIVESLVSVAGDASDSGEERRFESTQRVDGPPMEEPAGGPQEEEGARSRPGRHQVLT